MKPGKKIKCRLFQKTLRFFLPVFPYKDPEILRSFEKVAEMLDEKGISQVLLITDRNIRGLGLTKEIEETLAGWNIGYSVYEDTVANPTIQNVEDALSLYYRKRCQALLAVGGGSSIDCAKVVGARIACPEKSVADMEGLIKIRKEIPLLIAIPTTAGTGSETTLAAVIADEQTHRKYPIEDFNLIPDYAVLVPQITLSLPASVTATTGMDALAHAIEVYIGRSTTRYTRQAALQAIRLIFDNLEIAFCDGQNLAARANMLEAAYLAGSAFSRSYVGYVHAVAHSLGGKYGVAHGQAVAVTLPVVLRAYGDAVTVPLAELANAVGLASVGASAADRAEAFICAIEEMNNLFGIPETLSCIQAADIPSLAAGADAEANPLYPVPVLWDRKELESIYDMVRGRAGR